MAKPTTRSKKTQTSTGKADFWHTTKGTPRKRLASGHVLGDDGWYHYKVRNKTEMMRLLKKLPERTRVYAVARGQVKKTSPKGGKRAGGGFTRYKTVLPNTENKSETIMRRYDSSAFYSMLNIDVRIREG